MELAVFTFNDFYENTYILYDTSKECIIIDPGCNSFEEEARLSHFIEVNNLKPVRMLNTHCHIDHVLGNLFVSNTYGLKLEIHAGEKSVLDSATEVSRMYGIPYKGAPKLGSFIEEGSTITFGNSSLEVLYTPGHSPASVSFFNEKEQILIAGDVLFEGSIGRTDLPGGNFETLIQSIKNQYFPLDDAVKVYPGHGPSTTIGKEKQLNPFLQ